MTSTSIKSFLLEIWLWNEQILWRKIITQDLKSNLPTTLTLLKVAGSKQKPIHIGGSPLSKMSGLNFRQLPVANGTAFFKIFKNEDNLASYTQIFEKFTRKFSFQLTSLSEFLKSLVEWFAFRKLNSFRNFWKLFREILFHLPLFLN